MTPRPTPPARGDLVDDLVGDGRVGAFTVHGSAEVVDHHRRAATCQLDRIEAAEAPPGAGDHGDLACRSRSRARLRGSIDWRRVRTLRWNRYLVNERGGVETGSTSVDDDGPQRLGLLASALAGRTVAVASGGAAASRRGPTASRSSSTPPRQPASAARVGDGAGVAARGRKSRRPTSCASCCGGRRWPRRTSPSKVSARWRRTRTCCPCRCGR